MIDLESPLWDSALLDPLHPEPDNVDPIVDWHNVAIVTGHAARKLKRL